MSNNLCSYVNFFRNKWCWGKARSNDGICWLNWQIYRSSFALEVIINGKKVNSQKLKLPSGKILKGKDREIFETNKIKLDVLKSEKIIGLN